MENIVNISDYIIFRCKAEGNVDLNVLKHQKLLYYVQSWYLAFEGKKAFEGDFQAWIHGPVNREIYELYKDTKYLYSEMSMDDIKDMSSIDKIDNDLKIHIDTVLDSYAKFNSIQLELMTHDEEPWLEARKGFASNQRCENIISNETMQRYYAARLK